MQIWYVSYGSNLSRDRFDCYLKGGTPPHARAANPGARDPSPPAGDRAVVLPGTVWFASSSERWGGAVAFYDDAGRGAGAPTLARAYLLTGEQLLDVAAQELGLHPGTLRDLPPMEAGTVADLTEGRYGRLVGCEPIDGVAAATLTAPWSIGDEPARPPSLAYLQTLADGLAEAHHLDVAAQARYLSRLPGVAGTWDAATLTRDLRASG